MTERARSLLVPEVDFEKDGVQHGFVRLFHSVHASAYGFIPIPIVVIRNGPGKTVLFVSGNHGDEYEGQVAISNLAKSLKPEMIKGRVILLPMANYPAGMAGQRTSPIDEGNLNRSFPGRADGTVTQQIAYWIEHELLPLADIVCDLHSGGSSLMYVPTVLTRRSADPKTFKANMDALRAFAAPLAYLTTGGNNGSGTDNTLSGGVERMGWGVWLGTELGGSGTVTPAALKLVERGLRNILVHAGILPKRMRIKGEAVTRVVEVVGADYFTYTPEPGVFEPVAELGDEVKAGQLAGRIHFPETPWREAVPLHFARAGVVLCKRIPGRTVRGDCLFHLGSDVDPAGLP
jgi:predicted deacylase